jgi:hypothetical protein
LGAPTDSTSAGDEQTHASPAGLSSPRPRTRWRARKWRLSDGSALLASIFLVVVLAPAYIDLPALLDDGQAAAGDPDGGAGRNGPGRAASPIPDPGNAGPATVVVRDTFSRSVQRGWGDAELGGTYSIRGVAADMSVDGDHATVRVPQPGVVRSAFLPDVSVTDADVTLSVVVEGQPVGSSVYVYGVLRRVSNTAAYRPKLFITPEGEVYAHAGAVVDGLERSLGRPALVPGLRHEPGDVYRLRATISDRDPTTLRVRVWDDSEPEPEFWHFSVIDWTGALSGAGSVGVAVYVGVSSTSGATTFRFDELSVTTTDVASAP